METVYSNFFSIALISLNKGITYSGELCVNSALGSAIGDFDLLAVPSATGSLSGVASPCSGSGSIEIKTFVLENFNRIAYLRLLSQNL